MKSNHLHNANRLAGLTGTPGLRRPHGPAGGWMDRLDGGSSPRLGQLGLISADCHTDGDLYRGFTPDGNDTWRSNTSTFNVSAEGERRPGSAQRHVRLIPGRRTVTG